MDSMVTGMSPLAMMSMHEQYPWMKEKKSSRKQMQGRAQPRLGSCISQSQQFHFIINKPRRPTNPPKQAHCSLRTR